MIILGINDGHDASAAVLVDGVVVAAMAEERRTRRKHTLGFPAHSIRECLRIAGITASDIDRVAVSTIGLPPRYFMANREATFSVADYYREQRLYWYPLLIENRPVSYNEVFADHLHPEHFPYDRSLIADEDDLAGMRKAREKLIAETLGVAADKIRFHDHHDCHAYYAYGASPWRDQPMLVYTADGAGDGANGSVWVGRPGELLEPLCKTELCNIGRIYRYITLLLGMKPSEHEFKVMGLAAYARAEHAAPALRVFEETLRVDGLDFTYKVRPKDHFFHFKEQLEGMRFDNVAAGLQRFTENLLTRWVLNGVERTGIGSVAFAGGVAQNVKASKHILEQDAVTRYFVPPAANDESLSIGAAYKEYLELRVAQGRSTADLPPLETPYLGPTYNDAAIDRALSEAGLPPGAAVRRVGPDDIADLLAAGEVVARHAGRMEFGPRALGNRSILADPRHREVVQVINDYVKQRDFWMPFAASFLAETAGEYFENPKCAETRFMTTSFDTTPLGRRSLSAAVHPADFTTRPQTVDRSENPAYHAIISAFAKRTGIGAVLNTSFNLSGEPIVESPADAISTFKRCELRHLLLDDRLISKPAQA